MEMDEQQSKQPGLCSSRHDTLASSMSTSPAATVPSDNTCHMLACYSNGVLASPGSILTSTSRWPARATRNEGGKRAKSVMSSDSPHTNQQIYEGDSIVYRGSSARSESQSPPYKIPRWRGRQTGSFEHLQGMSAGHAGAVRQQDDNRAMEYTPLAQDDAAASSIAGAHVGTAGLSAPGVATSEQQQQHRQQQQGSVDRAASQALHHADTQPCIVNGAAGYGSSMQDGVAGAAGHPQATLLTLQSLMKQCKFDKALEFIESVAPGFLKEQPALLFDLQRSHFLQVNASSVERLQ